MFKVILKSTIEKIIKLIFYFLMTIQSRFLKKMIFNKKQAEQSRDHRFDVIKPITNSPGKYIFYCPGCQTNHVINTNPLNKLPVHTLTGTFDSPTIRASVLLYGDNENEKPRCHSYVTEGKIKFLNDCTHDLAGKTVRLKSRN